MSDWVKYESASRNLSWEKNKKTGDTRNEEILVPIAELKLKLAKAEQRVAVLKKALEETEKRGK